MRALSRLRRTLIHAILCASLLSAHGTAATTVTPDKDIKAAIWDLLAHGNLSDSDYVSNRLGIGLRISVFGSPDAESLSYVGTTTTMPPLLYGTVRYDISVDRAQSITASSLSFTARDCTSLQNIRSEWQWHLETRISMATDGGPVSDALIWPGKEGTVASITHLGTGCKVSFSQILGRSVSVEVSPKLTPGSGVALSRLLAKLMSVDLRNYRRVGTILNAEFIVSPETVRKGLLYDSVVVLGGLLPGVRSEFFSYEANDSAWYRPADIEAHPLHITDRTVFLDLGVDLEQVCLTRPRLAARMKALEQVVPETAHGAKNDARYSSAGSNPVTLSVRFDDGCADRITLSQLTDAAHSIGWPILFKPVESIDPVTGGLTLESQHRINLIASRLRSEGWSGMQITPVHAGKAVAGERDLLAQLAGLIHNDLLRHDIGHRRAPSLSEAENDDGQCGSRIDIAGPAVCVDVWR